MKHDPDFVMRQAECATMLVAVARMLLDSDDHSFAQWLRMMADDIEAKGIERGLNMTLAANDDEQPCGSKS